jgi:hypothetical protein
LRLGNKIVLRKHKYFLKMEDKVIYKMEEKVIYDSEEEFEMRTESANTSFESLNLTNDYVRPDFRSYPCGESDEITDITNLDEVIKWIRRYYVDQAFVRLETNSENFSEVYNSMIERAIKANVPEIVNIFHWGIYFHDRSCPNHTNDLKLAASYADVATFKLTLCNFFKDLNYNGVSPMTRKEFEDCVKLNTNLETKNWIKDNRYDLYNIISYCIPNF